MPFKYSLPDTGEHSKESNRFWEIISEIAELSAIVETQSWATDCKDYDAIRVRNYLDSLHHNLQKIYERDYVQFSPTPNMQGNSQHLHPVEPPRISTEIENISGMTDSESSISETVFAPDSTGALAVEISNGLRKLALPAGQVNFNSLTRFFQLCLEGLEVKYIEPSIDNIVGIYYESLKTLGVAKYSQWNTENPVKLYQNLASSSGITRITIKPDNGTRLVTYRFSEEERMMAYKELGVAGIESHEIDKFILHLRNNYDLSNSQLMRVSEYVESHQEHSEILI